MTAETEADSGLIDGIASSGSLQLFGLSAFCGARSHTVACGRTGFSRSRAYTGCSESAAANKAHPAISGNLLLNCMQGL